MSEAHKKILKGLKLVNYKFKKPPLVLGGLALEYYGIRKTKHDYDYMVSPTDWKILKKKYPDYLNLFGGKNEKDVDATLTNINNKHVDLISTLFQYNYNYFANILLLLHHPHHLLPLHFLFFYISPNLT